MHDPHLTHLNFPNSLFQFIKKTLKSKSKMEEMNGRPIFPQLHPPRDLHYAMVMLGGGISFGSDSTTPSDLGGNGNYDVEIGGGRWPKEETLTLLQIRSRLDSIFKQAIHKAPLWDQVSRIMFMEHGYKRSGKKCSEKFENLYKYYKKIKEGKSARQDKKHYRFLRQLEAIYGETSTGTINRDLNTPSVSNNGHLLNNNPSSCDFQNHNATLPQFAEDSDCIERTINKKRMSYKKYWKTTITDLIETKVNTLMDKQDAWMEKMMKIIDEKEKERISKEEEWRKEEAARLEIEKKFRANERAWMESRDSALLAALQKLTAKEMEYCNDQHQKDHNNVGIKDGNVTDWGENEITQLIQLRSSMETRFEQGGCLEEVLWEEIALTMACLGYNRNALVCKAKWDDINSMLRTKKRKENISRSSSNSYSRHNYIFHQAGERGVAMNDPQNDEYRPWPGRS